MITFLEYVCECLMGPPVYGRSWRCPFPDHDDKTPSFSVRPPKQRDDGSWERIRFKCHGCAEWGDEYDLLKLFYPNRHPEQYKRMLEPVKAGYVKLLGLKEFPEETAAHIPPPGERGTDPEDLRFALSEYRAVLRERSPKWKDGYAGLYALVWADRVAADAGVTLDAFIRCCASEIIEMKTRNARAKRAKR